MERSPLLDTILGAAAGPVDHDRATFRRGRHGDLAVALDIEDELGVVVTLNESHRIERFAGRVRTVSAPRVGAVSVLPPGVPARYVVTGDCTALILRLRWSDVIAWAAEDLEIEPDRCSIAPRLHDRDPALLRTIVRGACGTLGPEETGRQVTALLLGARPASLAGQRCGGIPPARLRRVLDRIEATLGDPPTSGDLPTKGATPTLGGDLTLAALAHEAGLSPFHFARAFRAATGVSPHQHVLHRRIEHAVLLLDKRGLSITDIAALTCFAHPSHLARHMRKVIGTSPQAVRQHLLP